MVRNIVLLKKPNKENKMSEWQTPENIHPEPIIDTGYLSTVREIHKISKEKIPAGIMIVGIEIDQFPQYMNGETFLRVCVRCVKENITFFVNIKQQ